MTRCRYFDGTSSRAWPASATVDGPVLRIDGGAVHRSVPRTALSLTPAGAGGPARIAFADGGLCEVHDRSAAEALFAELGYRPAAAERLVARTWQVVMVTIAFAAVMVAAYRWGVPWVADRVVDRTPRSWDEALGGKVLRTLDQQRFFRPTTLPLARRDRIAQRFSALHLPQDDPSVQLFFRHLGAPNAFALPGGLIVVTDEIVELAGEDDDAIATVLAHEIGHVAHRDAVRLLARSTLSSAIAAWYIGDVSTVAAVAASGFGNLRYTRDAERDADRYALQVMRASHISTKGAAALFRRLSAWEPPKKDRAGAGTGATKDGPASSRRIDLPEYLSTHPATEDRVRLFERDEPDPPTP